LGFLKKLNIIEAAVVYSAPCGGTKVSEQWKDRMMMMLDKNFDLIRSAGIELCAGYTGSDVPAIDIAQMSWTEWSVDELIYNTELKNP
jgi:hypothetical protein